MSGGTFPGGVAVTDLEVYDGVGADGCAGGSPHLHTASSEGYVVISGSGSVETLSSAGAGRHSLAAGDVLWFAPGTVHRLVNDGDLRLLVVMSNSGLPEAGDAVLTFPDAVLDDPDAYAAAASLPGGDSDEARAAAAAARRDLALEGYARIRAAVERDGPGALAALHERAARLVRPRVAQWTQRWRESVDAETERTRVQLSRLADGDATGLAAASVHRAAAAEGPRRYGMCGRLRTWDWDAAEVAS